MLVLDGGDDALALERLAGREASTRFRGHNAVTVHYPRRPLFLLPLEVAFFDVFLGFTAGFDLGLAVFPRFADSKRGWVVRMQVTETSVASKIGGGDPAAFMALRMVWMPCPSAWASWRRERNHASAWFRQRGVTAPVRRF